MEVIRVIRVMGSGEEPCLVSLRGWFQCGSSFRVVCNEGGVKKERPPKLVRQPLLLWCSFALCFISPD